MAYDKKLYLNVVILMLIEMIFKSLYVTLW